MRALVGIVVDALGPVRCVAVVAVTAAVAVLDVVTLVLILPILILVAGSGGAEGPAIALPEGCARCWSR